MPAGNQFFDNTQGGICMSVRRNAKENNFQNIKFFVDDGYSGTTFTRPAFMEMMELAESGKITTIIVTFM